MDFRKISEEKSTSKIEIGIIIFECVIEVNKMILYT